MCKPPSAIKLLPIMKDLSEKAIHKIGPTISSEQKTFATVAPIPEPPPVSNTTLPLRRP